MAFGSMPDKCATSSSFFFERDLIYRRTHTPPVPYCRWQRCRRLPAV